MQKSPTLCLFYYPFTCGIASHIILEESGLSYQRRLVDIHDGRHRSTDYMQLNPKGIVPALQIDQELLTESQAILSYIADQVPEKNLIPPANTLDRAQAYEWMTFCATSMHSYARSVFRPAAYAGESAEGQTAVRNNGLAMMRHGGELIEQNLKAGQWSAGENFSVSDAYLYIIYLWSQDARMSIDGDATPEYLKWRELAYRVHNRAATQTIIKIELSDRPDYRFPSFT